MYKPVRSSCHVWGNESSAAGEGMEKGRKYEHEYNAGRRGWGIKTMYVIMMTTIVPSPKTKTKTKNTPTDLVLLDFKYQYHRLVENCRPP